VCLNVIVAVKSPALDVFGWLLHDCIHCHVFDVCSQYRVIACFIEYLLYGDEWLGTVSVSCVVGCRCVLQIWCIVSSVVQICHMMWA